MTDHTDHTDHAVPPGLADQPLAVRRAQEAEGERVIREGIARRHLAQTGYEQAHVAVHFDRLLREGPTIAAKLRRG